MPSTIATAQMPAELGHETMPNSTLADAILDRLVQPAYRIQLQGESMRKRRAGIYALFSAGTRDAQTIFAGIAIAVVSTLLGIVVSIVLELLETITHGWASRYVEAAEAWANQVRYSLMAKGNGRCADH